MFGTYATAAGPANVVGIDLHTIWDVRADASYAIDHARSVETSRHLHPRGGIGLICIRTRAGHGRVRLTDGADLLLERDNLLLLPWEELASYACAASNWSFWWFEFTVTGPLLVPLNRVLPTRGFPGEAELFRQACRRLRRTAHEQRCLASVAVLQLLYSWLAVRRQPSAEHPYRQAIEHVIDRMHERLNPLWPVRDMARAAHMSERNFRKVFRETTGQSPKQFYHHLRLTLARRLLAQNCTVTQAAHVLGFSSPYHLSREFKACFGLAPSQIRRPAGQTFSVR